MAAHARHIFKPAHYVQVLYGLFIYPGDGKVVRNMTTSSHMCECLWAPKSLIRHVFFVDEKFTTANYERSCHCVKWRFRPRLLKSSCIAEIKWSSLVLLTIGMEKVPGITPSVFQSVYSFHRLPAWGKSGTKYPSGRYTAHLTLNQHLCPMWPDNRMRIITFRNLVWHGALVWRAKLLISLILELSGTNAMKTIIGVHLVRQSPAMVSDVHFPVVEWIT